MSNKTMMYALQMQKERQAAKVAKEQRDAQNAMDILKIELQKRKMKLRLRGSLLLELCRARKKSLARV